MPRGVRKEPEALDRQLFWLPAYALSPFVTVFREMLELRYLWQRLVAFLGAEPHTPIDAAVHATLVGLGCLPNGNRRLVSQAGAQASSVFL